MPFPGRQQLTCTIWQAATILQASLWTSNLASWPKNTRISPLANFKMDDFHPAKIMFWTTKFINKFSFADFLSQIYNIFPPMENLILFSFYIELLVPFYSVELFLFFVQKNNWVFLFLKIITFAFFRSNNKKMKNSDKWLKSLFLHMYK